MINELPTKAAVQDAVFRQVNAGIKSQNLPDDSEKRTGPTRQLARHKRRSEAQRSLHLTATYANTDNSLECTVRTVRLSVIVVPSKEEITGHSVKERWSGPDLHVS